MRISTAHIPYFSQAFEALNYGRDGWNKGQPRVFKKDLDGDEIDCVRYILDNLANKSWVTLLKRKKELKKRGDRLDHVHPLSFFMAILCHYNHFFQTLKKRGGKPLNEFLSGAVDSFNDEKRHNNITLEQIHFFCQKTGKDVNQIQYFVNSNNWHGLIKWL